jgi:hypothetical protein
MITNFRYPTVTGETENERTERAGLQWQLRDTAVARRWHASSVF